MMNAKENVILWDDYFVDEEKSNCTKILHHPVKRERVLVCDRPYEGDGCGFFHIVKCPGKYRMYYNARGAYTVTDENDCIRIAVLESEDGLNWHRIDKCDDILGKGKDEINNVIFATKEYALDNFIIFYDENPNCPKEEKFKALSMICIYGESVELVVFVSEDGFNFKKKYSPFGVIKYVEDKYKYDVLMFDTMNTCFWDKEKGIYRMFVRGFHNIPDSPNPAGNDADRNAGIRDIRYSESKDFVHWTEPKLLQYTDEDYPMYVNQINAYYRDSSIYVGFPTRYIERHEWNDSFEELCGRDARKKKVESSSPRAGLAITDCLFMHSRDCLHWKRYNEAFLTPGPEEDHQWEYGGCYLTYNMIETKRPGYDNEISLFNAHGESAGANVELYRYSMRIDGFVSRFGDYYGKTLVSKEFLMDSDEIRINFSTSAAGSVKLEIETEDGVVLSSCEHFGDKIDRLIKFNKPLSSIKGKKCILRATLKDAHLYSIYFN